MARSNYIQVRWLTDCCKHRKGEILHMPKGIAQEHIAAKRAELYVYTPKVTKVSTDKK